MTGKVEKTLETKGYSSEYKTGIKGIKSAHHKMINVKDNHAIHGSMDIDEACKKSNPNDSRWDYLIVVIKNNRENLAMLEVHGATPKEVGEMVKKKEWVIRWLVKTGLKDFPKAFIWIASGKCAITPQSRYSKNLAKNGISGPRSETPFLDIDVNYKIG